MHSRPLRFLLALLLASGVTAVVLAVRDRNRSHEARDLREANNRLRFEQGLKQHAAAATAPDGVAHRPASTSPEPELPAPTTTTPIAASPGPTATVLEDYRFEGTATPAAALQTLAWHGDRADVDAIASMIVIDESARARAQAYFDSLPSQARAAAGSLDRLAATELTGSIVRLPFPRAGMLERAQAVPTESEDRVVLTLPGSVRERMEFRRTPDGWKYVITETMVEAFLAQLSSPRR